MDLHDAHRDPTSGTYEVGYKKPPLGTRFKKGNKQATRKKKKPDTVSLKDLLWDLLQERRRVVIEGKVVWPTIAELISRRALLEADKGSSILMRLCNELMLGPGGADEDEPPEIYAGWPPRLLSRAPSRDLEDGS